MCVCIYALVMETKLWLLQKMQKIPEQIIAKKM